MGDVQEKQTPTLVSLYTKWNSQTAATNQFEKDEAKVSEKTALR